MAYKGKYQVINIKKYSGDYTNVIYRSLWERKYMSHLDTQSNVLKWASEPFWIQYFSEVHNKYKRYYPDFWVRVKTSNGIKEFIVEIKPHKETVAPKEVTDKRKQRRYLREVSVYVVNQNKWKAARKYAARNNMVFKVVTEKQLGLDRNGKTRSVQKSNRQSSRTR